MEEKEKTLEITLSQLIQLYTLENHEIRTYFGDHRKTGPIKSGPDYLYPDGTNVIISHGDIYDGKYKENK